MSCVLSDLHKWIVVVDGQNSGVSSDTTSYSPPSITTATSLSPLSTNGGTAVTLTGNNFGTLALSGLVTATYTFATVAGLSYVTDICTFIAPAHTKLTCPTIAGVGPATSWQITIGGQPSNVRVSTVAYSAPSVTNIIAPALACDGSELFTLQGSNFGPAATPNSYIQVVYGPGGNAFTATGCSITTAQTEVTCTSMAGAGASISTTLTIATQTSLFTSSKLSYALPVITSVTPALLTTGGSTPIRIDGTNLVHLSCVFAVLMCA